jgi:hypothetical protein
MADQNQERRNQSGEAGPQPDPALHEGPATSTRTWIITGVIAAAVLAVMYGITAERHGGKTEGPAITTGANQPPSQQGGRTTGDAPATPSVTTPAQKSGG